MNATANKISGKTKQAVGSMTNNKKMQATGKMEETKGNIKSTLKNASDDMTDSMDNKSNEY